MNLPLCAAPLRRGGETPSADGEVEHHVQHLLVAIGGLGRDVLAVDARGNERLDLLRGDLLVPGGYLPLADLGGLGFDVGRKRRLGHIAWGENRQVLIFRRTYDGKTYIRMRVFNRHTTKKGCFYPAPRAFLVGQECARELGLAIARAAEGRKSAAAPEWWAEFQEQYERKGKLKPAKLKREPGSGNGSADLEGCRTTLMG